jgi:phosphatidylglycerol:prolipoprotein diacylglycerol transferase
MRDQTAESIIRNHLYCVGSMIPYVEFHNIDLGFLQVPVFGLLVATGILLGRFWLQRRTESLHLDAGLIPGFVFWIVFVGMAGAVLMKLAYEPERLVMLFISPRTLYESGLGIASFGGLFAGLPAGCLYLRYCKAPVIPYLDALAFVFPRAWLFGRLGCALAHDHPGIASNNSFAVRFPGGPRFDLGLLEVFYTLAYLLLLKFLDNHPRGQGFYIALFLTTYGVFRLALDQLHESPPAYLAFTVDQWASFTAIVAGFAMLFTNKKRPAG